MGISLSGKTATWAVVILAGIVVGVVNVGAQSPATAPAPAMDCMTPIYNMSDCLTYVEQGSNATKPDKACCPELAGLLDSNPICLCHLLGKSSDFPVQLDLNRALQLPKLCRLQTPPVSMCSEIGIPVGAPSSALTSSEAPSSALTSSEAPSSAPTSSEPAVASEMSPTTAAAEASTPAGKNGASMAYTNLPYLIAGLAIALSSLSTL